MGEKPMNGVKFVDNSAAALGAINAASLRGLERCGQAAEGYAKDLCPVGTPESTGIPGYIGGTLRNSITHAIDGSPAAISAYTDNAGTPKGTYSTTAPDSDMNTLYIGTNVEYSVFVETGTRKMAAQPYLKPALADHVQTYRNIMADEMKNA